MLYRLLADVIVIVHVLFVAFVVFGAVLVVRWRWLAWLHLPAAAWGALIEFAGWVCPLTPLENALRARGGEAGYSGGFVAHYILPALYPAALTRDIQYVLGGLVLAINITAYAVLLTRLHAARQDGAGR